MYKQTRLCNKYMFANNVVNKVLQDKVEVEMQNNHYKVFKLIPSLLTRNIDPSDIEICSNSQLTN